MITIRRKQNSNITEILDSSGNQIKGVISVKVILSPSEVKCILEIANIDLDLDFEEDELEFHKKEEIISYKKVKD